VFFPSFVRRGRGGDIEDVILNEVKDPPIAMGSFGFASGLHPSGVTPPTSPYKGEEI